MDIRQYLDSTYLMTAEQAVLSEAEHLGRVRELIAEAIRENFRLVMVRPEMVPFARQMVNESGSKVHVGTVIDFPGGNSGLEMKIREAQQAIADGADELDFVCDYNAFRRNDTALVKHEVLECTVTCLAAHKTVKWIIETAALDPLQIVRLSSLIKNVVVTNFHEESYANVFVKSSTGFYDSGSGASKGVTQEAIILMLENASPLQVKASGGIRSFEQADEMIRLGVRRIGTSSAKAIADRQPVAGGY